MVSSNHGEVSLRWYHWIKPRVHSHVHLDVTWKDLEYIAANGLLKSFSQTYLFFCSSSLFALLLKRGNSCWSSSLAASLSLSCEGGPSWFTNWNLELLPRCKRICNCILELPSGLIFCSVSQNIAKVQLGHLIKYSTSQQKSSPRLNFYLRAAWSISAEMMHV